MRVTVVTSQEDEDPQQQQHHHHREFTIQNCTGYTGLAGLTLINNPDTVIASSTADDTDDTGGDSNHTNNAFMDIFYDLVESTSVVIDDSDSISNYEGTTTTVLNSSKIRVSKVFYFDK